MRQRRATSNGENRATVPNVASSDPPPTLARHLGGRARTVPGPETRNRTVIERPAATNETHTPITLLSVGPDRAVSLVRTEHREGPPRVTIEHPVATTREPLEASTTERRHLRARLERTIVVAAPLIAPGRHARKDATTPRRAIGARACHREIARPLARASNVDLAN